MKNHREEVLKFFNDTDNYLHRTFGVRVRKRIIYELLGDLRNKKILDVGCGNGVISLEYAKKNNLTLIDISSNMLDLAKANAQSKRIDNINYYLGSIEEFDSPEKYDAIIAIGLLSHVSSINDTIVKLKSLLNNDGNLIIQFSDLNSFITKINLFLSKRKYIINRCTKEDMFEIINSLGYDLINEIQYSILLPGMGRLPDKILYYITMLTYQNSFLSNYGTEVIWNLKKIN